MFKSISEIVNSAKTEKSKKIAVACGHDKEVILSLKAAVEQSIVEPILVGDEPKTLQIMKECGVNASDFKVIHEPDDSKAALAAVKLVHDKKADMLMKGLVSTSVFLKSVLNKECGLRTGSLLSHVTVFEFDQRLMLLTDVAMNVAPDLQAKVKITENAAKVAHKLGMDMPKVAPLCAVEVVNPDMPATLDAAMLSKMSQRKQIKGAVVDGPLALDNAVSVEAAEHKGIKSEVAGHADILLAPDIEAGNVLYKALHYFAHMKMAAIITGAAAPIVLTSRADTDETKFHSIALAAAVA